MRLCIDQTHQWHNTMLSRAVTFFPRKMRYQGQPLEINRSRSLLEEMKRNALQQTDLCTASTSRKHQALLSCFTPWKAEYGYLPLGKKTSVSLSAGRKNPYSDTHTHKKNNNNFKKISKAFNSACLSHEFCLLLCHFKIWLNFLFHFPLKSWQQPTCFQVHLCE